MIHVLILRYTVPAAEAEPHVPGHAEFLERHHADGTFVLRADGSGGNRRGDHGAGHGQGRDRTGCRRRASDAALAAPHARRCVQLLQERLWEGDEQLAAELRDALGEQVSAGEYGIPAWPLETTPVDLAELADELGGDPGQSTGVVDLQTGVVWPPGITDYDPPEEMDEDSDDYDEDRWLHYSPESGEAYRDMLRFTDHVTSEQLRLRLLDALDGRGAFRRFRDVLSSGPDDVAARWQIYRQERALGRARAWLASHGFHSKPQLTQTARDP